MGDNWVLQPASHSFVMMVAVVLLIIVGLIGVASSRK